MSIFTSQKLVSIFSWAVLSFLGISGCVSSHSGEGFSPDCVATVQASLDCPSGRDLEGGSFAQFCQVFDSQTSEGACTNVCDGAKALGAANGREEDFCEIDADCNPGLTCDNDSVGSSATTACHCVPETGDVTGGACDEVNNGGSGEFRDPCDDDGDCREGICCFDFTRGCAEQFFCSCI